MSRKIAEENQQLIRELHCRVSLLTDRLKDIMQSLNELRGFAEEEGKKVTPRVICPLDEANCVSEERCKEIGCVFFED